jgi:hypothetical protein
MERAKLVQGTNRAYRALTPIRNTCLTFGRKFGVLLSLRRAPYCRNAVLALKLACPWDLLFGECDNR